MTTTYIIQDTDLGFIQYITDAESPEDALAQFGAHIGHPLDDLTVDDWRFTEATPEMVAEAEAWAEAGHPADNAPAWAE